MSDLSLQMDDNPAKTPPSGPMGQPPPALVLVEDVTKSFGNKVALEHVSFGVPSGQICGLLGPNGAGKTTFFRHLMGILKATDGRLMIDGLDAFEDRVVAGGVASVFLIDGSRFLNTGLRISTVPGW